MWFAWIVVAAATPCDSLALCLAQCDAGRTASCLRAGAALEHGLWGDADNRAAALSYRIACAAGSVDGCARAADYSQTAAEEGRMGKWACDRGSGTGCLAVLDLLPDAEVDAAKKQVHAMLQASCDNGAAIDCLTLARLRWGRHSQPARAALIASATVAMEHACAEGDLIRCFTLAQLEYEYLRDAADRRRLAAAMALICEAGGIGACHPAAYLNERDRPFAALRAEQRGCELGDAWACAAAADRLGDDQRVPRDPPRRAALLERACDDHFVDACYELARVLAFGAGVPRDEARAARLYASACATGDHEGACRERAIALLNGAGVTRDAPAGFALLDAYCRSSDTCQEVATLFTEAARVTRDPQRAVAALSHACAMDYSQSCVSLGTFYERGDGIGADREMARSLYARACHPLPDENGHTITDGCPFLLNLDAGVANPLTIPE